MVRKNKTSVRLSIRHPFNAHELFIPHNELSFLTKLRINYNGERDI